MTRFGRYGGLDSGGVRWAKAGSGLAGMVGCIQVGCGGLRWGMVWQVWHGGY